MKNFFLLAASLVASASFGQSTVTANQGQPGTQGAWPVRLTATPTPSFPADGGVATGSSVVSVYPYTCAVSSPNKVTTVSTVAVPVPATAATNRLYTVVCNSRDNASGVVRCRADGTAPVAASGNIGDVLGVGDCVPYTNPSGAPIQCIALSALFVTTYECRQ